MADHRSDCAVHNGPAMPAGACDCGIDAATAARAEIVAWLRAERRRYTRDKDFSAAIALMDAAKAIESGAPQRWAAERDAPTQRPEPVSQRSPPPPASPARRRE